MNRSRPIVRPSAIRFAACAGLVCLTPGCAIVNGLLNTALQVLQLGIQLAPMLLLVSIDEAPYARTIPVEVPAEALAGALPSFEVRVETPAHAVRLTRFEAAEQGFTALVEIHRPRQPSWQGRVAFPFAGPYSTNLTASVRLATPARS